jgi:selenoprotein W-related protein
MEELMKDNHFRFDIKEITIIPSGGGVFEVTVDDELIFSKKEQGRFPANEEIVEAMQNIKP